MKNLYLLNLLLTLCYFNVYSQLDSGGFHARFGIDADTRAGYLKYGPVTGNVESDDWFGPLTGLSRGVIDTSNASYYRTLLQANTNTSFIKRMAVPLYSKINGTTWLDGIYCRDFMAEINDSTTFLGSCKNGDDPLSWSGGPSGVPVKNDLTDIYAHLRRNGTTINDSLWLFTTISTLGTTGDRYFDIELYKNNLTYNKATGTFPSGGPDQGHTAWIFDASGNITQTGDLIIAVSYASSGPPVIDVRIWVARTTFTAITPALFNFGGLFNGSGALSLYGYANIISKAGGKYFGAGIGNYSSVISNDTTYSTPWGTRSLSGPAIWSANYNSLQLVDIGINLTRIGIDPSLYAGLGNSACDPAFRSIFFKSRSSSAFTANLQDFVGPINILQPVLDHAVTGDSIACNIPTGTLTITSRTTAANYSWKTTNGNITGSDTDSTIVTINKTGSYIIESSAAEGCLVTRRDTITVIADSTQPVATADTRLTPDLYHLQLLGGDTSASKIATSFGGSLGLSWSWTGPGGFTSSIQNPVSDTMWGTYRLITTELRNGCKDTAEVYINFTILSPNGLSLTASRKANSILLNWKNPGGESVVSFNIERSNNASAFVNIGSFNTNSSDNNYSFIDKEPGNGTNIYRIKAITETGMTYYSNVVTINTSGSSANKIYLSRNYGGNKLVLVTNSKQNTSGRVAIFNLSGELVSVQNIKLMQGQNVIEIDRNINASKKIQVIAVYVDNKLAITEKIIE